VQELISAAQRIGIARRIADEVRAQGAVTDADWESSAERAAAIAALGINDFVADLGYGALPPDRRPQVPPEPRPGLRRAFQPPPPFDGLPALASRPRPPAHEFRLDWLSAFVQLAQDNLGFSASRDISERQNAALGRILERAGVQERELETV
jgi:hypothetical protein